MVVDTSAIVAILFGEPDAERYATAIGEAPELLISAVTRVGLSFVVEGRKGDDGRADLGDCCKTALSRSSGHAVTGRRRDRVFRRFGRGRHRAGLNIGDCFSYALAEVTDHPLLFNGDHFIHTDIGAAPPGG